MARAFLQRTDAPLALFRVCRQIAIESETLAVQPAGHQRQQQGRGADQWPDGNAFFMREPNKVCSRVGNGRDAGFRYQTAVLT